jgi:hypothetical protein
MTSPMWGKKNEERSVVHPPLSRFSDFEEKAAILNCGRNTLYTLDLEMERGIIDVFSAFFSMINSTKIYSPTSRDCYA